MRAGGEKLDFSCDMGIQLCMYDWRKMNDRQRDVKYLERYLTPTAWHSPPHFDSNNDLWYILTGTCYEHRNHIGFNNDRIVSFSSDLLEVCGQHSKAIRAWCVLPNHYHVLIRTPAMPELRVQIGKLHGRNSRIWNIEEKCTGRHNWHNCIEREMRSEGHYYASINYIHNNPVKHKLVNKWQDWPFSSANSYINELGREKAIELWKKYPVNKYGEKWDV